MSFSFVLLFENPYSVKIVSIPFDKLMLAYVVVTAVAAIAAVVTLLTIRGQLQVMRGQLRQMEETGKQTESLIAQASAQSNALLIAARAQKAMLRQLMHRSYSSEQQLRPLKRVRMLLFAMLKH
jgi:hypothetical protein